MKTIGVEWNQQQFTLIKMNYLNSWGDNNSTYSV